MGMTSNISVLLKPSAEIKKLTDTWLKAGLGFGAIRYWGGFLPLRIDYIYVTRNFSVQKAQTVPFSCSDHFAVVSSVFPHNTERKGG